MLGRKIDRDFLNYLEELGKTKSVTPCGEAGEYHSLVIDGPLFRRRVKIIETKKTLAEGDWIMEILQAKPEGKQ